MTLQESLEWIASIFEEDPGRIAPETIRDDIPIWDSLGMLTLMAGLNEKFNVVMSDSEIQNLRKVDDILEVLRRHGHLNGG